MSNSVRDTYAVPCLILLLAPSLTVDKSLEAQNLSVSSSLLRSVRMMRLAGVQWASGGHFRRELLPLFVLMIRSRSLRGGHGEANWFYGRH